MPLIVFTASSTLSVISLSTCSGAAPGSRVVTVMVGMSMLGIRSTPSWVSENVPTTTSDMMRTEANTGRRTQSAASACMGIPRAPGSGLQAPGLPSSCYLDTVGQFRDVGHRHDIGGRHAAGGLDLVADLLACGDDAFFAVVLHAR